MKNPSIRDRLLALRKTAIASDPHDADTQLNITIELMEIIEDIQVEIREVGRGRGR